MNGIGNKVRASTRTERHLTVVAMTTLVGLLTWAVWPAGEWNVDAEGGVGGPGTSLSGDLAENSTTSGGGGPGSSGASSGDSAPGQAQPDGTTAATPGAPAGAVPLTATDRGVTATEIRVAFFTASAGGAADAGFALGLRTDQKEYIKAFVDDVNARGGVLGRRIVPDIIKTDIFDESAQRATCLRAFEQNGDFAAIDVTSLIYESSQQCVTVEYQAPFVTSYPGTNDNFALGFPRTISMSGTDERRASIGIVHGRQYGYLTPQRIPKLGVLVDDCRRGMRDHIVDELEGVGFRRDQLSVFTFSCDLATYQAQIPQAVGQHKRAGATTVLAMTEYLAVAAYTRHAAAQLYEPQYIASDFDALSLAAFAESMDPQQWDGTLAATGWHHAGDAPTALHQHCNQVLKRAGVRPITNLDGEDVEAAGFCENLDLFVRVATVAGANLNRETWGRATRSVGTVRGAATDLSVFTETKLTGADSVAMIEYDSSCRCYRRLTEYTPALR